MRRMGDAAGMTERKRSALAWGIFLGVSWTWCIGMFLPVLLVRDLGPGAFVVFAVPNVIGAAGMGWVLSRDGMSEAWVERHRDACRAFSIVTILFHVFFAGWVISLLLGVAGGVAAILLGAMLWAIGRRGPARDVTAGMVVYLVSLVCVGLFLAYGRVGLPGRAGVLPGAEWKLLCLAPVCFFGFGLCPYLDLTFHRARQGVDARGVKAAFGTGFGVFFFSMILFTLMYSGVVAWRLDGEAIGVAGLIVGVHMVAQAGYTVAAHLREVLGSDGDRRDAVRLGVFTAAAVGIVLCVAWLTAGRARVGEVPYLLFMGFYGLVFPAYVWAALVGRGVVNLAVVGLGVVVAGPFYYVGFVGREMGWLVPGLAVAIAAGLVSARTVKPAPVPGPQ